MSKYRFIFILSYLLSSVLWAQMAPVPLMQARIAVSGEAEVLSLLQAGVQLADARMRPVEKRGRQTHRVEWQNDLRIVTAIVEPEEVDVLTAAGYSVINAQALTRSAGPDGATDYPLQFGWPRQLDGDFTIYGQSTTITDFNGNGQLEIFLSTVEGFAYLWRPNGTFVLGYPIAPLDNGWSTGSEETAAAGDVNGDGIKEAVFGRWVAGLTAYQYTGQQLPGFPRALGFLVFSNDPTVYDFDDDGMDEIVLVTYPDQTTAPATVHIYNADGSELPGWPQQLPQHSDSSPSIGDIDNDGEVEIIVGSGGSVSAGIKGGIYAFNIDGSICNGFPIQIGNTVNSSASIYDIDMDGVVDILIRVKPEGEDTDNGIYAYDGDGRLLNGFPAVIPSGGSAGAPAIADANGDGLPEIAYGTVEAVDSGKVWLWDHQGNLMPGFPQPIFATWVERSVVLEDVSGDSLPDIVCGTNGLASDPGKLWAFDYTGQVVSGFPVTFTETFSTQENTPTVIDIDDDGDTEIFTAVREGLLYAFDTPGVPAASSWPTYKFNAARHGGNLSPVTAINNDDTGLPSGIVLRQNYPNPFNPVTTVEFDLPAASTVTLDIFDNIGRHVETLFRASLPSGTHKFVWDAAGNPIASGVYYYRLQAGDFVQTRKMLLVR